MAANSNLIFFAELEKKTFLNSKNIDRVRVHQLSKFERRMVNNIWSDAGLNLETGLKTVFLRSWHLI